MLNSNMFFNIKNYLNFLIHFKFAFINFFSFYINKNYIPYYYISLLIYL